MDKSKKLVMFVADGFEEIEAVTAIDILRRAGIQLDICSVNGTLELTGSHSIKVGADIQSKAAGFVLSSYDGLLLPGGMPNAKSLAADKLVLDTIREFHKQGKLIGAICAAPIALLASGIISGRTVTSYPGVLAAGNNYSYSEEKVSIDGNIITSRGPATAQDFAFAVLEYLGYRGEAENLRRSMLYSC